MRAARNAVPYDGRTAGLNADRTLAGSSYVDGRPGSVSSIIWPVVLVMPSRGDLTDGEWAALEPLPPTSNNRCGRWHDHRRVINRIIHRPSTGCQWRKLPERFGPWQTIHKRHQPWSADGTWERLFQHVQAVADAAGDIDWNINVDSMSVRARQHAAGAPKAAPPSASKGVVQRSVHLPVRMRVRPFLREAVRQARLSDVPAVG